MINGKTKNSKIQDPCFIVKIKQNSLYFCWFRKTETRVIDRVIISTYVIFVKGTTLYLYTKVGVIQKCLFY